MLETIVNPVARDTETALILPKSPSHNVVAHSEHG